MVVIFFSKGIRSTLVKLSPKMQRDKTEQVRRLLSVFPYLGNNLYECACVPKKKERWPSVATLFKSCCSTPVEIGPRAQHHQLGHAKQLFFIARNWEITGASKNSRLLLFPVVFSPCISPLECRRSRLPILISSLQWFPPSSRGMPMPESKLLQQAGHSSNSVTLWGCSPSQENVRIHPIINLLSYPAYRPPVGKQAKLSVPLSSIDAVPEADLQRHIPRLEERRRKKREEERKIIKEEEREEEVVEEKGKEVEGEEGEEEEEEEEEEKGRGRRRKTKRK